MTTAPIIAPPVRKTLTKTAKGGVVRRGFERIDAAEPTEGNPVAGGILKLAVGKVVEELKHGELKHHRTVMRGPAVLSIKLAQGFAELTPTDHLVEKS